MATPAPYDVWICGLCNSPNVVALAPTQCPTCAHGRDYQIGCCVNPGEYMPSYGSSPDEFQDRRLEGSLEEAQTAQIDEPSEESLPEHADSSQGEEPLRVPLELHRETNWESVPLGTSRRTSPSESSMSSYA
jgi:hypothetical protein